MHAALSATGRTPGALAEELIADEVAALLKRAHHGPGQPPDAKTSQPSRRDLRVAARTRATRPGSPSRALGHRGAGRGEARTR